MSTMLVPKNQTLTDDMNKGIITLKAQDIKITQDGEHEILTIKKMKLFKGDKLIFKTPSATFYTNKKNKPNLNEVSFSTNKQFKFYR